MARTQTLVQLTDELVAALDAEAARLGESRSAYIRRILEDYLSEHGTSAIGRRIAEGYLRIPPGTPDAWGTLDSVTDQGTRELLERLDHEERESGLDPW
jgi:hypothetical protein